MIPAKYRRIIYMLIAIVCTVVLCITRIFRFDADRGIIYNREYVMDFTTVYVLETDLETGDQHWEDQVSVVWLARMAVALLSISVLLLLFCWQRRISGVLSVLGMVAVALYYFFCVYYSIQISDRLFATIVPKWPIILPVIILQMHVMALKSVTGEVSLETEMLQE